MRISAADMPRRVSERTRHVVGLRAALFGAPSGVPAARSRPPPGVVRRLVCPAGRKCKSRRTADDRRRRAQDTFWATNNPLLSRERKEIPVTRLFSFAALAVAGALVL